ncbi:MAG: DNA polymerase III subunit beta [Oscillospiraceae bacterium]|jgi:DNA polymerase-3 subunit beta|nr:DNA polymerase III subunit beta [Oscillospiraceae bacterium]
MKLLCDKTLLQEAVLNVSRSVSPKSTIAAIEGILLRVTKADGIFMCGYNLEMGITCSIEANVKEEGAIVLPSKIFCEIVRRLPADTVSIEFLEDSLMVTIKSGEASYEVSGLPEDDFPELPNFVCDMKFSIPMQTLKSMISQTRYTIAENFMHPQFTGACFEITSDNLNMIALDGKRIAVRSETISSEHEMVIIVPGKTLSEVQNMIGDSEDDCEIAVAKHHVNFTVGKFKVMSRLLEGTFFDFRTVRLKDYIDITVSTRRMIEGVERMSLVLPTSLNSPLRCFFDEGEIKLYAKSDLGTASDTWEEEISCTPLEIWFKNQYVLDAFKYAGTDTVRIRMGGEEDPMLITPPEGEAFRFILMPIRQKVSQK